MSTTRSTGPLQYRRGDPRGQVLVLFALVLVVLLLVSALAIDYGGWLVAKRNYQNVSDSASLAGAQYLTRPSSSAKQSLAKEAAWKSVATALGFDLTTFNAATRAAAPSNLVYSENGYNVWVASPPSDANVPCAGVNCLYSGKVYPGKVSSNGVVFVRIDHEANTYMSRIAGIGRNVSAWSSAGRFPRDFAVIAMCDPFDISSRCLAGDANIKLDGSGTNLVVETGDVGTNRWVKTGGNSSSLALGVDSNAYMSMYDTCWASASNQCQLNTYSGGTIGNPTRNAVPLGAPVQPLGYAAPTINSTTAPNQCLGSGAVQLASAQILEQGPSDEAEVAALPPIRLASVVLPKPPGSITTAAKVDISGTVSSGGVAVYAGVTVQLMNGATVVDTVTTNGSGVYSFKNATDGTYTIRVSDSTSAGAYVTTTFGPYTFSSNSTQNLGSVPKYPLVSGWVRNASTSANISGATVTITALGVNYVATTDGSGNYSKYVRASGALVSFSLTASATGFVTGSSMVPIPTANDTPYVQNFSLTVAPASLTGTITDQTTGLVVPNATVTLSSGESGTTDASGVYNIASTAQGSKTVTLSNITGYAYSTPASPLTLNVVGAATQNFTLWPKGCRDNGGDRGDYSCGFSTASCGTVTNATGANVSCSKFDQSNALRPGTYNDITITGCVWLDPKGSQTGLAGSQSAGIYHIKGTIQINNNSFLFGDGVTLVMDAGSDFDIKNGGGFVLNYGSLHSTPSNTATSCDLSSAKKFNDAFSPCFRTTAPTDTQDYAYAAWTTSGRSFWSSAGFPAYNSSSVNAGELGITFWGHGSSDDRFKLATNGMGFLFNGVLYAPDDDVNVGGGNNAQSAAGQIVGWTIEYHGGTTIKQNWYALPTDGEPFLIEPVLGQ